jgi:hypothetical protein
VNPNKGLLKYRKQILITKFLVWNSTEQKTSNKLRSQISGNITATDAGL